MMNGDHPNKSMSANGHAPVTRKDRLPLTAMLKAMLEQLDDVKARRMPIPAWLTQEGVDAVFAEVMQSGDTRAKLHAVTLAQELAAHNLDVVDTADKLMRGGNAPTQQVQKVYVNVPVAEPDASNGRLF